MSVDAKIWRDVYSDCLLSNKELEMELMRLGRGLVCIDGPSGCGKSKFLRGLDSSKKLIFPQDAFCRNIIHHVYDLSTEEGAREHFRRLGAELVCVEDIDMLYTRPATQAMSASLLNIWSKQGTIVVTGISLHERVWQMVQALDISKYYIYASQE